MYAEEDSDVTINLSPNEIRSAEDLSKFILRLREDFLGNPSGWENADLPSFLEAMSSWLLGIEAYHKNMNRPYSGEASWQLFAELLDAGRIYE